MLRELFLAHSRVLFAAVCTLGWMSCHAQTPATCTSPPTQSPLLNEVHTIADPSQGVPVECTFPVSNAGTYQVTLVDRGLDVETTPATPAPLAAVKLAVTSGNTLIGTTLTTPGDMKFDATPGTYVIHVVGLPGSLPGSGAFDIHVTNVSDSTLVASFSSSLAKPYLDFPATVNSLDDSFTVASDGSYVVTLTDLKLPQPLSRLTLVITKSDGTFVTNPPLGAAGSATVTLQQGQTYRILAGGRADTTVNAGLLSASVVPAGGGMPVYSKLVAIGTVVPLASVSLNVGGTYVLNLSDLSYPAPLASLGAIVSLNGQLVAQLTSAGTTPTFTAAAGNYQVFALATAATSGSYGVSLTQQGGVPAFSVARAVSAPVGTTPSSYSFDTNVPTAGTYAVNLADFGFPSAFASLKAVVVQNGAVLGQPLSLAGTQNVAVSAGPLSVLVFSQAGTTGSLFGVDLTATGASPVFETTQGVGQLFLARKVSITAAGGYAVYVSDVKFPAALSTFAVVVTRGSTQVGSIYGGGAFSFQADTPGNYFVNFIATPNATDLAGTYSLSLAPGPSVKLESDVSSITSGGVVHLKWSSTNTDSCMASGGWSGSQIVSGTATSGALTADTTFTLTCAGAGTTAAQSLKISVTAPPASSGGGGGGGALGGDLVLVLVGFVLRWSARRMHHAFVMHTAWSSTPAIEKTAQGKSAMLTRHSAAARPIVIITCLLIASCGGAQSRLADHMRRGQEYYSRGNYAKASLEFRNALQIAPTDPNARLMAGHCLERLGQFTTAMRTYQAVVDSDAAPVPANSDARASLARLLILAGGSQRGFEILQPAIKRSPDDPQLLTLQAAAKLGLKDEAGARTDVDRALKLQPTNEDAVALRAGIYRQDGEFVDAAALVSAAVRQAPSSTALREILASLYESAHDNAKAEEQLRALIQLQPKEPRHRGQLAVFYASLDRLDDAQHVLEDTIKAFPDSDTPKLDLVDFLATRRSGDQAEQMLRGLIARQPEDHDLRLHLGTLLEHVGKPKEAIDVYDEVARRAGMEPKGLIARDRVAAIYVAQRRYDDARKLLGQVLGKNPRDKAALGLRGEVALEHNDPAAAIADFRAVLRDQPRELGVQRLLARAHLANGEPGLAEGALRAALEVAPTDSAVRIELAHLLLQTRYADQAVTLLEETAHNAPKDTQVREELIRAYLAKRDFAAARSAAADLESSQPASAAGPYLAGMAAQGENRPDDARRQFEHALRIQPRALEALAALAHLEVSQGQNQQAVALMKSATEKDAGNAFAWNLLGELYMGQHDLVAANDALTHASKLSPTWWVPLRNLALSRLAADDTAGAVSEYDAAIKVAPLETGLVTELASLYEKRGRTDDAIARYEGAYRNNPHSRLLANNLAMLLVTYKTDGTSLDRARDLIKGFESSNEGSLLDTNGWVHYKRAEYADALPALERAIQRAPDSPVIRYHLGMAELQAGRTERARVDLQTAVSGAADFQGVDEARTALASLKGRTG